MESKEINVGKQKTKEGWFKGGGGKERVQWVI